MNTTPDERVRIFDREGYPLAEFRATVERSWTIADEGRAAFTYPSRKTDIVNEKVLNFGNWLLVENSDLPAWVGVIDTPREWTSRNVTVCAYSPEHVFGWRRGPLEVRLSGSPGTVFDKLLSYVNQAETTIIRPGNIHRGGRPMEETINPTGLDRDLERICERSSEEYQWRPMIDTGGRLIVYADWMESLGITTGAILHEGRGGGNIETVANILVEDGPILNDLLAYGDGLTWTSRPNINIVDLASIGAYGRRQSSAGYSGVTNVQTLKDNGLEKVLADRNPLHTFKLHALNVGDTFKHIDLGNRLTLRMENVAFGIDTTVRITGMAYDPESKNKIELVVEEI
jgi:hypothetical protein